MSYQGATLGLISSDTFKNRTQATRAVAGRTARFKSRGNNMDSIDAALAQWEQDCNKPNVDSFQKTALLMIIERECNDWLTRKRGKSSRLAEYRRGTIQALAIDAKKAAAYMRNKYKTEQKGGRIQTKSLDRGHALERQHYLQGGKQHNPNAAGDVASPMGGNMDIDNATLAQYAQADAAKVYYHNRAERMQYLTYVEGGLFYDGGSVANCQVEAGFNNSEKVRARMYAVDKYGSMFTKEIAGFDGTYFNHSSFCAGKEIICAGTVVFTMGQLRFISTNSGHYKPAPPQLQLLLTSLASEDVRIDGVCVYVKDSNGNASHLKLSTFMNNARAATDWPHFDDQGRVQVIINAGPVMVEEPG